MSISKGLLISLNKNLLMIFKKISDRKQHVTFKM
jgi:hypothetical protein